MQYSSRTATNKTNSDVNGTHEVPVNRTATNKTNCVCDAAKQWTAKLEERFKNYTHNISDGVFNYVNSSVIAKLLGRLRPGVLP